MGDLRVANILVTVFCHKTIDNVENKGWTNDIHIVCRH